MKNHNNWAMAGVGLFIVSIILLLTMWIVSFATQSVFLVSVIGLVSLIFSGAALICLLVAIMLV